jgi:hypothetical protein
MNFKIAICTYKRAKLINERTLLFLRGQDVPNEDVFLFIGGQTEEDFTGYDYLRPDYTNLIRVPAGLHNSRNAVADFFPEGTPILFLDDDLKKISHLHRCAYSFKDEVERAFKLCKELDISLFSFYPTVNYGWMQPTITAGLFLCYGCAYGCINTRAFSNTLDCKEDYERSAWHYLNKGAVLRVNYLAPVQNFRNEEGGLSDLRSIKVEESECDILLKQYPELLRKQYRQHWPELKFKRVGTKIVFNLIL